MIERTFIQQAGKKIEIEEFLRKHMARAGFLRAQIIKTPLATRIIAEVIHPSMAIGKGGQNIKQITIDIEKKYAIENPQLEIKEIKTPELDAQAMADRIANTISRGMNWRSASYKAVKDIMHAGANGVEIALSGVLAGKGQRKRKVRLAQGYMKKVGDQAKLVDRGKADAHGKIGTIGIKVSIVRPETIFPDKIKIGDELLKRQEIEKQKKEMLESNETKNAQPIDINQQETNEIIEQNTSNQPSAIKTQHNKGKTEQSKISQHSATVRHQMAESSKTEESLSSEAKHAKRFDETFSKVSAKIPHSTAARKRHEEKSGEEKN